MSAEGKYSFIVLWEHEIREAAKLLQKAHDIYAADPDNDEEFTMAITAGINACSVALHGVAEADDETVIMLSKAPPAVFGSRNIPKRRPK